MTTTFNDSERTAATAEKLREELKCPLLIDEANRHLELLGVTETDDVVFTNWRKSDDQPEAMHQRVSCSQLADGDPLRIKGGDYSFGFIPGRPLPVPEGWTGWFDESTYDPELGDCWKKEVYGSKKSEIEHNPALMADCDGGIDIAEARRILEAIGLPAPTFVINTGGRGFHFYWAYKIPLPPSDHQYLMRRLIKAFEAHPSFGIDKQLHNTNRVMRLAGSIHPKTGKRVLIQDVTGTKYSPEDFDFLPAVNQIVTRTDDAPDREASTADGKEALQLLTHISATPSEETLNALEIGTYNYWLKTGMALKECGLDVSVWDEWSAGNTDPEHGYQDGECAAKWDSFDGMESSPLGWLAEAAKANGYVWERDRKGWKQSEEGLEKLKAAVARRKEAQGRWDADFDYELGEHETIELKVEQALHKMLAHEGSELIYLNGVMRRYDAQRGYYCPWSESKIQAVISDITARVFEMKQKGKRLVKMHKWATTPVRRRCFDWIGPRVTRDSEDFIPAAAIAFRNCTLVKIADGTWEPQPHSSRHQLTFGIDHDYVPDAECPMLFREFIRTSYGEDLLAVWRALVNYHANPGLHCRIFLFFLGESGTGKGTALRLLQKLFPINAVSSLSNFSQINSPEKLAQQVAKSHLIAFPDLQGKQDDAGALYPLTDYGQVLSGRDLFSKEPIRFIFRGRVVLASTQLPNLRDANTGFKRRVLVVETLKARLPSDLISSDPRDADVWEDKLAAELGSILSWAMAMPEEEVAQVLAKQHPALQKSQKAMAANIDSLHTFVDQCLEPAGKDSMETIDDLYSAFMCFLQIQGQASPLMLKTFKTRLRQILPHLHRDRQGNSKNRVQAHFYGLRLLEGLWGRRNYELMVKDDAVTAGRTEQHGAMRRSLLEDGHLEELETHNPV